MMTRISHRRMTSKVKGQSRKVTSLEAGGGIPCRPNPVATLLVGYVNTAYITYKSNYNEKELLERYFLADAFELKYVQSRSLS